MTSLLQRELRARARTPWYAVITSVAIAAYGLLLHDQWRYVTDRGLGRKVVRLGLKDTYAHGASKGYLLTEYELDALALVRAIERELDRDLGLTEADLAAARVEATASKVNAESL